MTARVQNLYEEDVIDLFPSRKISIHACHELHGISLEFYGLLVGLCCTDVGARLTSCCIYKTIVTEDSGI